jgi:predicted GTPase
MEKERKNTDEFYLSDLVERIMKGADVSEKDKQELKDTLEKELTKTPFNVAVIGQGGVGKTSMMQTVFGIQNGRIRAVQEGTLVEKTYDFFKGFNIKVTDFPGLNNDYKKDRDIYIPLYKEKLPQNDLIMYVMDINKAIGDDVQILKDIVIPICKESGNIKNIIIILNKVDMIAQTHPNFHKDKNLSWNIVKNEPTMEMVLLINDRLDLIKKKFEEEGILNDIDFKQVPAISAIYAYNQAGVIEALLNSETGWKFLGTIAPMVMADRTKMIIK